MTMVGVVHTGLCRLLYLGTGNKNMTFSCKLKSKHFCILQKIYFRLQGYTNIPIPTHRKIQECLVDIGDKPFSFIGSKQWIGSTEVGFVLETMLGVSIKVLCASSGEEMASLSSNLAHHFQTQGTPVMIGKEIECICKGCFEIN